jgi:hypothetical protein
MRISDVLEFFNPFSKRIAQLEKELYEQYRERSLERLDYDNSLSRAECRAREKSESCDVATRRLFKAEDLLRECTSASVVNSELKARIHTFLSGN